MRIYICVAGPGDPSDQLGTGAKNTVTGSTPPAEASIGVPGKFAPQVAAGVLGFKAQTIEIFALLFYEGGVRGRIIAGFSPADDIAALALRILLRGSVC